MFATVDPGVSDLDEVLDRLESVIDAMAAVDHDGAGSHARRSAAMRLHQLSTRLDAERVRLVGALERHGDAQLAGAVNTRAWLHHECGSTKNAAGSDVRAARRLVEFPTFSERFAAGEVSRSHVEVLVRAARPQRMAAFAGYESELAHTARKHSPEDFHQIVGYACGVIDDDLGASGAWDQIQRRRVHLSTILDGMGVLNGILDPAATETVTRALEHMMHLEPDADSEHRDIGQRRADALTSICQHILTCADVAGTTPTALRRNRPHISTVVDLTVLEARGHLDLAHRVRADTAHGRGLSAETLLRMSCDANISRIITDGPSEVIDVGRATRTIPPALWKALVARDGGCRKPGCTIPPARYEVHHITHWAHGGPTTLQNTELKYPRHHIDEHEGHPHPPPDTS